MRIRPAISVITDRDASRCGQRATAASRRPGWTDEYAWTGWIPFDDLPHAYNPAQGYVVSANNKVVPDTYPYFLTHDWAEPFRRSASWNW